MERAKALNERLLDLDLRNDRVMWNAIDAIDRSHAAVVTSFELDEKLVEISANSEEKTAATFQIRSLPNPDLTRPPLHSQSPL